MGPSTFASFPLIPGIPSIGLIFGRWPPTKLREPMGFMLATTVARQAFLPVLLNPTSSGPWPKHGETMCRKTEVTSLHTEKLDAPVMPTTRKWPWMFKQPGRCVELPAEEVFEGFEGLLLDELDEMDDQEDQASYSKVGLLSRSSHVQPRAAEYTWRQQQYHTKNPRACIYALRLLATNANRTIKQVSREVRKACYAFVSLDAAPAPELVMLSKAGARLTGIPVEAMRDGREDEEVVPLNQIALGLTGTSLDVFAGAQPFSSNYGGHQFGNWAGQLGDGRVCTLGEIETEGGVSGSILEVIFSLGRGCTTYSPGSISVSHRHGFMALAWSIVVFTSPVGVSLVTKKHVVSAIRWRTLETDQLPNLLRLICTRIALD